MSVEMVDGLIDEKGEQGAPPSSKIKYSSLEQMRGVKVLNLSRAQIVSLPNSLSEIRTLRSLVLHDCTRLRKLPSLSNLKELQLLDLSRTSIEELPQGTEDLINLRHLRLSHTSRFKIFRAGVLPSLPSLEELCMHESSWVWRRESEGAQVDEITELSRLSDLVIELADWSDLAACMSPKHRRDLKRFHLSVGFWGPAKTLGENTVVISGCDLAGKERPPALPERTLRLVIQHSQLSELISVSGLAQLKDCCIKSCTRMECLTTADDCTGGILTSLEKLEMSGLPDMRILHKGVVAGGSFTSLKVLILQHCHGMTSVFSAELPKQLQNLEKLSVSDCYMMEEMTVGADEGGRVILPRLKSLVLRYLPKLKNVYNGKWVCESLECVEVDHCPMLKKLPLVDDELPPRLRVIYGSLKWWEGLEWERPNADTLLLPLLHPLPEEEDDEGSCIEVE